MTDLSDKRALVTGAGIGQGIAEELACRGVDVHYAHTEPDETVAEIEGSGKRAPTLQGDLSKVEECERVVDEAARALGGLDVLVNNAGVTRALDFLKTDEATYDEVLDLNMKGYFLCARRAVPYMLEAGGGASRTSPRSTATRGPHATRPTRRPRAPSTPSRASWPSS
jgi:NAD(P)-dependent dehydrogenase (short-subunit alcohol dehydrogenase family)